VQIQVDGGKIIINSARGSIDDRLKLLIKSHKEDLINYFNRIREKEQARKIEYQDELYYEITPSQIYWVDDEMDKEYKKCDVIHGKVLAIYDIEGSVDWRIFKKAVVYLFKRHESLRSTFHNIEGRYLMKVEKEDSGKYVPKFMDCRRALLAGQNIQEFINFQDHTFDFKVGPLFLIRLTRMGDEKYVLSVFQHHIISDTWSDGILQRDLMAAYSAYSENREPDLPFLKGQYKEYLSMANYYSEKDYADQKKYWSALYNSLPGEIIIPGFRRVNTAVSGKIAEAETFLLSAEITGRIHSFAKGFSTSQFVIFQAMFKLFVCRETGAGDILIGTYVIGREDMGSENQVGCYARTVLIRTVLDTKDSFNDVVRKVIKSNEEMRNHTSFPLRKYLESMMPPEHNTGSPFWNINMQFYDRDLPYLPASGMQGPGKPNFLKIEKQKSRVNSFISIDMQLEFIKSGDKIKLLVQYDSSLYNSAGMKLFISRYLKFMDDIA